MSKCNHPQKQPCRRTFKDGSFHLGFQCGVCGRWFGAAKGDVDSGTIYPCDETAEEIFNQKFVASIHDRVKEKREAKLKEYHRYVNGEKWKEKRNLVIKRDGGICQSCLLATAVAVHHTTYPVNIELGEEPLYWLKAVCISCHKKIHEMESRIFEASDLR